MNIYVLNKLIGESDMNKIIYLDHAATTGVDELVLKEMIPYFSIEYGNASSLYSIGRRAKRAMEESRRKVANKEKGNHIITTKIEHHAVTESCEFLEKQGFRVTYLNVDEKGFIDLKELENSICEDTILISIMFANNEIRYNRADKTNW